MNFCSTRLIEINPGLAVDESLLATGVSEKVIIRKNAEQPSNDYLFVNNLRFWSMLAVVFGHSVTGWSLPYDAQALWIIGVVQPFKFGTISFFVISGFLLGTRLNLYGPVEYFMRRTRKIFLPWLLCFTVYAALSTTTALARHAVTSDSLPHVLPAKLASILLDSAYWFVPNILISTALLLLLFKRHIYSPKLGAVLALFNLFYAVNLHMRWVGTQHTRAIAGFVFYLWVGAFAARFAPRISEWVSRLSLRSIATFVLITCVLSYAESYVLWSNHSTDSLNVLRISNQLFSISVIVLFFKLRTQVWPALVDVRATTFGVYLLHPIVLSGVMIGLSHFVVGAYVDPAANNPFVSLGLWAATFVLAYGGSLVISDAISRSPLRWTIGGSARKVR